MNRAERRRKAKEYTPYKLDMWQEETKRVIKQHYENETEKRMTKFIRGYTTLVTYVLWYGLGLDTKTLGRFIDELKKHLDILGNDKKYDLTILDMLSMLKEEAGLDLSFLDSGKKIDPK